MTTNEGENTPIDETSTSSDDAGADPIRQLKGETHRKFDKLGNQLAEMQRSQQQLAQLLQQAMAPAPRAAPKTDGAEDLNKVWYSDPVKAAQIVSQQTRKEVMDEISVQQRTQNTIAELAAEYPELADKNSELTKIALAKLNTFDDDDRRKPSTYKLAVMEAAQELSVKPRSKRDPDEFAGPSHNPYGAPRQRREESPQKILAKMAPIATKMGLDMSNPEVQKNLLERAKRNYSQMEAPLKTRKGK